MTPAQTILFKLIFIAGGLFLIFGASRRWRWLVDPPAAAWPFYSQALIKKLLGRDGLLAFTYFEGLVVLGIGMLLLLK